MVWKKNRIWQAKIAIKNVCLNWRKKKTSQFIFKPEKNLFKPGHKNNVQEFTVAPALLSHRLIIKQIEH